MSDIEGWLEQLGLGRYAAAFIENEIDRSVLPHLTEADLKEMGLPIGPRRKVLAAAEALDVSDPVSGSVMAAPIMSSPPASFGR